jgi:hypothetical protein
MRLRSRALVAIVATAAVVAPTANIAHAATARSGNLRPMYIREDGFLNYDFGSESHRRRNVDWAVSLIFWNNASIEGVKNSGIGPLYDQSGDPEHAFLSESRGYGWAWDDDKGRKTTKCPGAPTQPSTSRHYRIYADNPGLPDPYLPADRQADSLYNLDWGYWVFGTIHLDVNECPPSGPAQFGWSETQENQLVRDWRDRTGWPAINDWKFFYNYEPFRVEHFDSGDHVWENNGSASAFYVGG